MTDGWVLVPRGFVEFLLGETAFDGLWFGDAPRYVKGDARYGQFWWRHDLRAMLAAAPPVDGWQPIETAPRDGTAVVGWGFLNSRNDNGPLRSAVMVAHVMRYRNYASGGGDWVSACLSNVISQHPTHWMPLPQPPNNERTG